MLFLILLHAPDSPLPHHNQDMRRKAWCQWGGSWVEDSKNFGRNSNERNVLVSSNRNIRDHLWKRSTYFGRNILIEILNLVPRVLFLPPSRRWRKTEGPGNEAAKFLVFIWRHHFLKYKITNPSHVLVSSGVRPSHNLTFCNVYARQGSSLCRRVSLNFQVCA